MKIFITGGRGMLGRTLSRHWSADHTLFIADLPETDITDAKDLGEALDRFAPDCVVHCAAMTNVDRCETEREAAFRLNAEATAGLAETCAARGIRLIAISTDYVFAGNDSGDRSEDDPIAPATVYGASKAAGEEAVRRLCPNHIIARIAWLYGAGGPSFVHTMAKLAAADPKRTLKVVDDQVGNPTSCDAVADELTVILARPDLRGTFHMTCEGTVSWHGFAQEIFRLLGYTELTVDPCTTEEYPRPAPRPHCSALSKAKLVTAGLPAMPTWQEALARFVKSEWPSA